MTVLMHILPAVEAVPSTEAVPSVEMLPIVERITLHTAAAIIEGPVRLGLVADPGAVRAAVLRWAGAEYETNPVKRAYIDKHVLLDTQALVHHVVQVPLVETPLGQEVL